MAHEKSVNISPEFSIQSGAFLKKDINEIIQIHRKEITLGFLTTLGDKALSLLFAMAARSKHSVLLTIKDLDSDKQVGFLLGTLDTSEFYKDFLRKKIFTAIIVLAPKLFSLNTVRKLIEVLLYPSKKEIQQFPDAELLDIAISKKYQGKGLAKQLFNEFCCQLHKHGIQEFKITTGEQLENAQRFYESVGAIRAGTIEVHKGKKNIVYIYKIPGQDNTL